MKIEEGMYVRTEKGKISKIKWISSQAWKGTNTIDATIHLENGNTLIYPRDDFKSSKNIIDLIEVGDYVNGFKVYEVDRVCFRITLNGGDVGNEFRLTYLRPALGKNMGIKTILTKEQYENNCYKVEE